MYENLLEPRIKTPIYMDPYLNDPGTHRIQIEIIYGGGLSKDFTNTIKYEYNRCLLVRSTRNRTGYHNG